MPEQREGGFPKTLRVLSGWSAMGTRQEMASSGPDFLRDSGPLPLQLLTGFKLKDGRSYSRDAGLALDLELH